MGDQVKGTASLSVYHRFILYSTPAVTSLLFCITFYQLALHKSLLRELQSYRTQQVSSAIQDNDMPQIPEMNPFLRRYVRTAGSDKGAGHELDQYFGKIAEWQVS
jgi:hypothetical protein